MKKNIVLIGFMGSGKTTVGIRLSYRLRKSIEDTDKLIEKREKRTIREIFDTDGERYFRELETRLLQEAVDKRKNQIISVGGGTPVREENRELLKRLGTVVYFRAKPETIYERIRHDTTRPLLQCENPLERITELLKQRKDAYESCADIIIDVDDLSMPQVVDAVAKALERKQKEKTMKILVINGPNLNFLGIREKSVYGTQDYDYLLKLIQDKAKKEGCEIETYQSNHEGDLVDKIQQALGEYQGILINAGGYTHTSVVIRDAIAAVNIPTIEVHMTNIHSREDFRHTSLLSGVCKAIVAGFGKDSYLLALEGLVKSIE